MAFRCHIDQHSSGISFILQEADQKKRAEINSPLSLLGGGGGLIAKSCLILCDSTDCSPPVSSVVRFPRQENWNWLPFPSPRVLLDLGIKFMPPALQTDFYEVTQPFKRFSKTVMQHFCFHLM